MLVVLEFLCKVFLISGHHHFANIFNTNLPKLSSGNFIWMSTNLKRREHTHTHAHLYWLPHFRHSPNRTPTRSVRNFSYSIPKYLRWVYSNFFTLIFFVYFFFSSVMQQQQKRERSALCVSGIFEESNIACESSSHALR